jgi:hypothetical protein
MENQNETKLDAQGNSINPVLSDSSLFRYKYLKSWCEQCIVDYPEIITKAKSGTDFYVQLFNIWTPDVQKAMRDLILEIRPDLKK